MGEIQDLLLDGCLLPLGDPVEAINREDSTSIPLIRADGMNSSEVLSEGDDLPETSLSCDLDGLSLLELLEGREGGVDGDAHRTTFIPASTN